MKPGANPEIFVPFLEKDAILSFPLMKSRLLVEPGSIIVRSYGFMDRGPGIPIPCKRTRSAPALEVAIKKAHDAGMFVVLSAGNDACDTKNYSPKNIPESFVVGSTSNLDFINGKDRIACTLMQSG
jgi:hypothetical protein